MSYRMSGHFIESCDCTVVCPCWVDDDPVGGHCTGFIAWEIDTGVISRKGEEGTSGSSEVPAVLDGVSVGGCRVVSVATHAGNRRDSNNTTTMLYIDVPELAADGPDSASGATTESAPPADTPATQSAPPDPDEQFRVLVELFSGRRGGTLAELSQVSGTVVGARRARIEIGDDPADPAKGSWRVTVRPHTGTQSNAAFIEATGHPKIFDADRGNTEPLVLAYTAISYELSAVGSVEAQAGKELKVNVGALPGGNIEVTGRSGMRGRFSYDYDDRGRVDPPERAEDQE